LICEKALNNLTIYDIIALKGGETMIEELSAEELDRIQEQRERKIYKADVMVNARYSLSVPEQRLILYAISMIQKNDTADTWYTIDLSDFCKVCGAVGDSYTKAKRLLQGLRDKSWFAKITPDDPNEETTLSWFDKVKITKGRSVRIRFDDDIFPYVKDLLERYQDTGQGYTSYVLQSVLPMQSKYGIRLYELLKSKIKTSHHFNWYFLLDDLKKMLECENYKRYPDFRRYVIEPAITEINKYSDINVNFYTVEKRNISKLYFDIDRKSDSELMKAHQDSLSELEGNIHYWDFFKAGDEP
jgi:plasmid replication initiation protein